MKLNNRVCLCVIAITLVAITVMGLRNSPAHAGSCGPCPFTVTATSSNTSGYILYLNNVGTNNQPNIVLGVTQRWPSAYDAHPIGVWYDVTAQEWTIFNEDLASIPLGTSFVVNFGFVGTGTYHADFTVSASAGNSSGDSVYFSNPDTDYHPGSLVFVTQDWTGTYDPHNVGVWYDGSRGEWAVFNEDGSAIPSGSTFFIFVSTNSWNNMTTQVATAANTSGYITYINNPNFNNNPGLLLYASQVYDAGGSCGCIFNNHPIAVWYDSSAGKWAVYNVDLASMPVGSAFFVQYASSGGGI